MSLEELKRNIERSIMRRQLLSRELEAKIAVTETEARADYDAHRSEYDRPSTLHLQEIVVKTQSGSLTLANDLVRRARSGEDFAELARAYSAAPTRSAGGDLGRLSRGDLTPDIEKVAFALPAGGVSDPLPTAEGFRILKVVEKAEATQVPFEDVKAEILKRLSAERTAREYESYMEGLRKEAIIDVRVREVPLQASVPGPKALELPDAAAPAANPDAEISTTPQARPEHVVPEPRPSPTPTPR
jgi:parvulin-like peptidyl-prolyl isomerase